MENDRITDEEWKQLLTDPNVRRSLVDLAIEQYTNNDGTITMEITAELLRFLDFAIDDEGLDAALARVENGGTLH